MPGVQTEAGTLNVRCTCSVTLLPIKKVNL